MEDRAATRRPPRNGRRIPRRLCAAHGFDRGTPHRRIDEAAVSPAALTAYIADDGAFIHPLSGPERRLHDRDLMVYALKAGYGAKGATIGTFLSSTSSA